MSGTHNGLDQSGLLDLRRTPRRLLRYGLALAPEGHMSLEGLAMISLLVAGIVGGLLLWTKFGSRGGHDQ